MEGWGGVFLQVDGTLYDIPSGPESLLGTFQCSQLLGSKTGSTVSHGWWSFRSLP